RHPMSPNILFATVLLLLGGAGYGSMFAANKIVADAGFPVLAYLFWQSLLGAVFVFGLHAARWRRPNTSPRAVAHYVGSASFGMLIPTGVLAFVADVLASDDVRVSRLPVVAVIDGADIDGIKRVRDGGINAILLRPFSPKGLMLRVKKALDSRAQFIRTTDYTGPCRRQQGRQLKSAGVERRAA
ncbi:MAG: hypothetical protein VW405_21385, partial [Rhodospirillaceae bacterium]